MKKLFTLLVSGLFTTISFSQVPEKMSFQAVVRNEDGELVRNSQVGVRISIFHPPDKGISYIETQIAETNNNGLLTLEIGVGDVVSGDFSTLNWGSGDFFITTDIDPEGGVNYTISGTSQILSVPYAFYSKTSATANNLTNPPTTVAGYGITDAVTITGDQTITGNKIFTGTISVQSPVSESDASTKEYVDGIKAQMKAMEYMLIKTNQYKLMDIDDNQYNVVIIGTQIWMAENLKTTRYNDGTTIDYPGTNNTAWANNTTGAYAWFINDEATYKSTYGALYNYYAVSTGKLCPTLWHEPSDEEWTILENYLIANGYNYDGTTTGNKIAKAMASHDTWAGSTNTGAPGINDYPSYINKSGFTALPGGGRESTGTFGDFYELGLWWSSSMIKTTSAYNRYIGHDHTQVERGNAPLKSGFSVRCLKDN